MRHTLRLTIEFQLIMSVCQQKQTLELKFIAIDGCWSFFADKMATVLLCGAFFDDSCIIYVT